jgi:glycerol-3-phosphate O-acyltransferase / dihydroxyacetone phosphate acyltransferase
VQASASRSEPVDRLYRSARALVTLAMRIFFRRIAVRGAEHIPSAGPVILAANHPSGLIDTFSIALATPRKVNFVARSTLFDSPRRARWLLRLGVIPIYRRLDAAAEMGRNVEVFRHCYELLERGGVIGIFPEGITHVDPQVKEMKTGAARIGLEAEARRDFGLGVQLIPVGLNFSKPGAYRSDLTVLVGQAIPLAGYAAAHGADPAATARQLTATLRDRLEGLVVHLDDPSKQPIVDAAFEVFGDDWLEDPAVLPGVSDRPTREIEVKRRVAAAIEYYSRFQPVRAVEIERRIAEYRAALQRLRLTEEMLRRDVDPLPLLGETLPVAVVGILGAPLALFGWLINSLPQLLTGWLARRFAANPTQLAAYKMWIGLQAFALCYGLVVLALYGFFDLGRLGMLVALLLFPATGYLASRYVRYLRHYAENVRLTALHLLRRGRLQELRVRRTRLDRYREELRHFLEAGA